ncbi:MAG: peptide chain release factor N(5)-glutamine methyltransferase [Maritimibacter sp.]
MSESALDAKTDAEALSIALRLGADLLGGVAADPMREAKLLLGLASGQGAHPLHHLTRADFSTDLMDTYMALLNRRVAREPMSHILGYRDFWTHRFKVTKDVLDPRPDTETLVAEALNTRFDKVLDLGTGSGCILISLLAERPSTQGVGVDLSPAALDVARENANAIGVAQRSTFLQGHWFAPITTRFDLIVSNPPYIGAAAMPRLAPELSFEPRMALTDEADGLDAYREITQNAAEYLTAKGRLMVEIGFDQATQVRALFEAAKFQNVTVIQDINGRDRVVTGGLS